MFRSFILMATITTISQIHLKTTPLDATHECPKCKQHSHLQLDWFQPEVSNFGGSVLLKRKDAQLSCSACHQIIRPKDISPEIKSLIKAERENIVTHFRIRPSLFFYGLVIFLAGIFTYFKVIKKSDTGPDPAFAHIKAGTKMWTYDFDETAKKHYTWFLVSRISGDTVFVRQHKETVTSSSSSSLQNTEDQFSPTEIPVAQEELIKEQKLFINNQIPYRSIGKVEELK